MLTRFVRIQLIVFTIMSIVGVSAMVVKYINAPALLGVGTITVRMELPTTGGLYRFSNVTYRGVQVGKVTSVTPTATGALATMKLDDSFRIPADLRAEVRSVSAVGEQYVDLQPRAAGGPYLGDGSMIAAADTVVPQRVGPMLDSVSALVGSIPKDRLSALLDESYRAFNGAGDDFGSLLDSARRIARDFNSSSDQVKSLAEDSAPLLQGQADSAEAIRTWTHSLAGVTDQLADNDPQVRTLLRTGPGFAQEASRLLEQIKPTLPILLANLSAIGQIGITYHPSLEQLLVLLPPYTAALNTVLGTNNPTGLALGDFTVTVSDPPACTVGFLPPSQWRSPADLSDIDTPDGLYCKLPQDSPISVRGVRNFPCMDHPGKRAPTVQICDSDQPYMPLAQRQHATGPYPLDPNLIGQGIPPDSRVNSDDTIFGPTGQTPSPGVPDTDLPKGPPAAAGDTPVAAPSAWRDTPGASSGGPSVAVVHFDPHSGKYVTPDGHAYVQTDLVKPTAENDWQALLPH